MESYVRPGKFFTANNKFFYSDVGIIAQEKSYEVIGAVVVILSESIKKR